MYIKNQPPDGYTFLVGSVTIPTWSPIHDNVDFTAEDFTYLGSITEYQQAMITTAVGLVVGIPALIGYNLLSSKAESLIGEVEASASRLLSRLRLESADGDPLS